MICPYCQFDSSCGRETSGSPASLRRRSQVLEAVLDAYSKSRNILDLDPLYLSQELVINGYFRETDPPSLVDVGHAQHLIRWVER